MTYTAPTPAQLQALKTALDYTGKQMAELACVGEQHWRKYTGGSTPREMPYPNLFHLAARLALSPAELARVVEKMREIGAEFDFTEPPTA
ncbi:helix-turn-helix domain-containing protein [Bordetella avium]|nr:helix-turn-helix domain-containing protein [Bordetella avium]RIQ14060.1 XRE family transcriptional regulator [Bordetella avium]RIQ17933.1 XRE family transcriptional regulator [Bordetella avium]RIQ36409.1 XRE family transcriptional regulator [Bordetella avium]RIQ39759.1 XRE family transcriptional regulator [Bordetella avium]RIQ44557.1 XRE family transcriptional regulator [Bordetella avium]